jgi:multidrug efflux pump subunit AcrA (membrane-fusion protein)
MKRVSMKRILLPALGVVAAAWATYSIARTTPRRQGTDPPSPPPASEYPDTVAAVGLVEASTENISIGTPLPGVVARVFVSAGQTVKAGDPLFELDLRQLRAELEVRQRALSVATSRVAVARAKLDDLARQLAFVEQVKDHRAISAEEQSRRRSAVQTATAELEQARSEAAAAASQVRAADTEIERSTVRAPLDTQVLQVKLRAGEFAPAGPTETPLMILGRVKPLHVRVDVDEQEAWKVRDGAPAIGRVRGNAPVKTPLAFVRFEPYVTPKRSLTGDTTERVDTRVLQVIYRVERDDVPLYVGQQLDVFIDAKPDGGARP